MLTSLLKGDLPRAELINAQERIVCSGEVDWTKQVEG